MKIRLWIARHLGIEREIKRQVGEQLRADAWLIDSTAGNVTYNVMHIYANHLMRGTDPNVDRIRKVLYRYGNTKVDPYILPGDDWI